MSAHLNPYTLNVFGLLWPVENTYHICAIWNHTELEMDESLANRRAVEKKNPFSLTWKLQNKTVVLLEAVLDKEELHFYS